MKYLLVLIAGFMLHKGLEEVYDYHFEKAFVGRVCSDQYTIDAKDPKIEAPLTKRFYCTYQEMGPVRYLSVVLARPHLIDGKGWYY